MKEEGNGDGRHMPVYDIVIFVAELDQLPRWDVVGFFVGTASLGLLTCNVVRVVRYESSSFRVANLGIGNKLISRCRIHDPSERGKANLKIDAFVHDENYITVERHLITSISEYYTLKSGIRTVSFSLSAHECKHLAPNSCSKAKMMCEQRLSLDPAHLPPEPPTRLRSPEPSEPYVC